MAQPKAPLYQCLALVIATGVIVIAWTKIQQYSPPHTRILAPEISPISTRGPSQTSSLEARDKFRDILMGGLRSPIRVRVVDYT